MTIEVHTDGSCTGNKPGCENNGGCSCVLIANINGKEFIKEHSAGFKSTTNNRMEITAVILALSYIKPGNDVVIYSDSKYVTNAFNAGWLDNWKKCNYKNDSVINCDLWRVLDRMVSEKCNSCTFVWEKGHSSSKYNNLCDKLAVEAGTGKYGFFNSVGEMIRSSSEG